MKTIVDAYKKASSASSSSKSSPSGKVSAGIPKSFQVMVHKNKKKIKESEKKWFIVESLSGPPTSVMLINDKTENLGAYFNANEAEIGKNYSSFSR